MNKISALLVVKDNPPFLQKVLNSIESWVDEIVLVDIGMEEALKKSFATQKKVKLRTIKEPVPYVELIREKSKSFASYENILLLDPDEIVPAKLKELILENVGKFDYFRIPRKNLLFGRWIKHSRWWPDYQIRFFKKNSVKWPTIIHHQPTSSGLEYTVEPLEENALLHYNYKDLDEYLDKAKRYAKHEAKEFVDNKKILTFKETVRRALNEFFSRYFLGDGYKDGAQGFILASFQMFYYFLVYFYYLEMNGYTQEKNIDVSEFFRSGLKQSLHYKKKPSIYDRFIKKIC